MRLYKPDNATVLKGALRNLLDGSRTTSIKHFINKAETIHQNFFNDYDAYDMDSFLPLYKQGATIILYNRDCHIFTGRGAGPDTDFIVAQGNNIVAYHSNSGRQSFNINNFELVGLELINGLSSLEGFLDVIWKYLSAGWHRPDSDGSQYTAVMAFDGDGNFLLPSELYPYVYNELVQEAGFIFWKDENQIIDNTEKHAVNSNTQSVNTQITENKGKNAMTKIANIVAANKSAVVNAAKLEAGKLH
ncbi:ORF162 [Escherichia phage T5]|uniref:ORF011 n=1 Tax=Escherichia phage T5 TaxID=2695836 RepID=Q5DMD2_BPT5|nr:ORF011 [Escherichia phage T5]AAX12099.1 ORF162 [Escherichia phage T5]